MRNTPIDSRQKDVVSKRLSLLLFVILIRRGEEESHYHIVIFHFFTGHYC
jgi:hypothetical protein